MSYSKNAKRSQYRETQEDRDAFTIAVSYLSIRKVLGDKAEDLGWAVMKGTAEQKIAMWQAWEAYYGSTNSSG